MELSYTDSISYNDDSEEVHQILHDIQRFQFTGMENVGAGMDDDSWSVESYCCDSMELNKLRLPHINHEDEVDDSSMGEVGTPRYVVVDADDWSVASECHDSMRLNQTRLEQGQERQNEVRPNLARITRRRTSLSDFVREEQGMAPPTRVPLVRRYSLTSVHTVEESVSSGDSNDPSGRRASLTRNKSMPLKTTYYDPMPLWSTSEVKSQKAERRCSNNGRPCAA